MNLNELEMEKQKKIDAAQSLSETRADTMDQDVLNALKTFTAEIAQIDMQIEAVNELRAYATKNSQPVADQKVDVELEKRKLFLDYAKGVIDTTNEYEKRAMTVAGNDEIVPDEFLKELHETILEFGSIGADAKQITTQENGTLSIPMIDNTANSGTWVAEGGSVTATDATTSTVTMSSYKVQASTVVSKELIEDSFFPLEAYLAAELGVELSRTMEEAYINGAGTTRPTGITVAAGTKTYTSAAAGEIKSTDLITAIYELQPTSRVGAVIYVSDDLMKSLTLEVDTTGRPLLQSQAGATPADPVKHSLNGYPLKVNYELDDVAAGDVSAIIGNPKRYMIRNVRGITIERDPYTGMSTDTVKFYATARVDGKVISANDAFVKVVAKA